MAQTRGNPHLRRSDPFPQATPLADKAAGTRAGQAAHLPVEAGRAAFAERRRPGACGGQARRAMTTETGHGMQPGMAPGIPAPTDHLSFFNLPVFHELTL